MKTSSLTIENFKELIDSNAYYIDKTQLIVNCIKEKRVLYTRPRRFGKTLNMSMLYYFFSNKESENAYLFDGLKVTQYPEVMKHQNQYPVIFLTLKDMKNSEYEKQLKEYRKQMVLQAKKYIELSDSPYLLESEKKMYQQYVDDQIELDDLEPVLFNLTYLLQKHYSQKVIVLIDEYDVPLQSAYQSGHYDEMINFLRSVFSSTLKTNDALEKGIMTGCLRISKESIFTGLNNFNVYSMLEVENDESFGFTESEVKQMLEYYHLENCFDEVKEWYDGYLFGKKEIYNPWSTLKYVQSKLTDPDAEPVSYWANTSGNDIVYNYIVGSQDNEDEGQQLHDEFDQLMSDTPVTKKIKPELTYREMDDINNIYSFLLLTGYLKVKEKVGYNEYQLIIPNEEVKKIYEEIFSDYFKDYQKGYKGSLYQALINRNEKEANQILNEILEKSISYYDSQEDFYHGFLVGLLSGRKPKSNRESGNGRFDICVPAKTISDTAILIECKRSKSAKDLIEDAKIGAQQIIDKKYYQDFSLVGSHNVIGYGIAFYKKQCYVVQSDTQY